MCVHWVFLAVHYFTYWCYKHNCLIVQQQSNTMKTIQQSILNTQQIFDQLTVFMLCNMFTKSYKVMTF